MLVQEKSITKDRTLVIAVLILRFINPDMQASRLIGWVLLLGCCAYLLNGRFSFNIKLTPYVSWVMLFAIFGLLSYFWAIDRGAVVNYGINLIIVIFASYVIYLNIKVIEDLYEVMKAYLAAILVNAVYLLATVDFSVLEEAERLGADNAGDGWNANSIGMAMALGIGILVFFANKKRLPLTLAGIAAMIIPFIYTGSRKAWAFLTIILIVLVFVWNPGKIVRNLILSVCAVVLVLYLVMEIPMLYNIVGYRFEGLFIGMSNSEVSMEDIEHSAWLRQKYSELGFDWFKENPIIGYGLNCYRALLRKSVFGRDTYSHNNYVELLVGVGIVGTVIFYAIYLFIIVNAVKYVFVKKYKASKPLGRLLMFWAGIAAAQLALHTGMVAYVDMGTYLMILLATVSVMFCEKEYRENQLKKRIKLTRENSLP